MLVAEWIAEFVKSKGVDHVFGVVGGGAMYLNHAFRDSFVPCHNEQAASFAADAYARLRHFGCCLVTTGPGGTNAITGVACAWTDSTPLMVVSGQVTTEQMRNRLDRHMGVQGLDIVPIVKHITKYAVTITDKNMVKEEFTKAYQISTQRPSGPVWLDVPLDIQGAQID